MNNEPAILKTETKICSNPDCLQEKPIAEFRIKRDREKPRYEAQCKDCVKKEEKKRRDNRTAEEKLADSSYQKQYRENHKEEAVEYNKTYQKENEVVLSNKKKIKRTNRTEEEKRKDATKKGDFYLKNRDQILAEKKIYFQLNKEKIKERKKSNKKKTSRSRSEKDKINKQTRERRIKDPFFRLRQNISSAVLIAIKNNGSSKNKKSILDKLPQSIEDLYFHLERLFSHPDNLTAYGKVWMTWENWGKYDKNTWDDNDPSTWKWQLDHIIPHSTFEYLSMDCQEFRDCWDLSNLRPYSAKQNILDGVNKIRHH